MERGAYFWVRFSDKDTKYEKGIRVTFGNTPTYEIGRCTPVDPVTFSLKTSEKPRLWTIDKSMSALHLRCDGETVFDYTFDSGRVGCISAWGMDMEYFRIQNGDTASISHREKPSGMIMKFFWQCL